MNREALANRCIDRLHKNGHQLFGCHCGRIHVDPMGIVNPKGWTSKQLGWMYGGSFVTVVLVFVVLIVVF